MKDETVVTSFEEGRMRLLHDLMVREAEQLGLQFESLQTLPLRFLTMMGLPCPPPVRGRPMELMVGEAFRGLTPDNPFRPAAPYPGSQKLLSDALSELRLWDLDADGMRTLADSAPTTTARKLRGLAEFQADLDRRLLEARRSVPTEAARRCMEQDMGHPGPIRHVVVVGGQEEKPVFERWLEWLARQGVRVDVVLESLPDRPDLFRTSQRIARRLGRQIEWTGGDPGWVSSLFQPDSEAEGLHIIRLKAPDALTEAEEALRIAEELTDRQGWLPGQVAIFSRDSARTGPLLRAAGMRLQIDVDAAGSAPLLTNGLARTLLDAIRIAAGEDVRPLERLARSSYCPTPSHLLPILRSRLTEAARTDRPWAALAAWIGERSDLPWLAGLVDWRERVAGESLSAAEWLEEVRELGAAGTAEA
ncbi:MAG: hypothetical protein MH204_10025, partial [Fimbriimonadaceae bacterium]|nr:hypothetical protein [Fimbriimonadaceae bacterium]